MESDIWNYDRHTDQPTDATDGQTGSNKHVEIEERGGEWGRMEKRTWLKPSETQNSVRVKKKKRWASTSLADGSIRSSRKLIDKLNFTIASPLHYSVTSFPSHIPHSLGLSRRPAACSICYMHELHEHRQHQRLIILNRWTVYLHQPHFPNRPHASHAWLWL